jgi:hypothetical protein
MKSESIDFVWKVEGRVPTNLIKINTIQLTEWFDLF